MDLLALAQYGNPLLVLGMLLYVVRLNDKIVVLSDKITVLQQSLEDAKSKITWGDTCDQKHSEIDRRLERLERHVLNGSQKDIES